ncbi:MAG: SET domain-containing protein [Candidatus Levyibacteriota bacterium]
MLLLPLDTWEIRITQKKGRGIFAKNTLNPGTVIGDYVGMVINNALDDTREKDGLYLMYYHDRASIYPTDLREPGIHLMNHSCMPNCGLYTYKGHTLFFSLRTIFPEEELTTDYLLSPDKYCRPCTHQCTCQTILCRGTMHLGTKRFEEWNTFHEAQSKETRRLPIRYGKQLKPLKTYPKSIPDHPIYNLFGAMRETPLQYAGQTLPIAQELRKTIRETGRIISFPKLNLNVLGFEQEKIKTQTIR